MGLTEILFILIVLLIVGVIVLVVFLDKKKQARWAKEKQEKGKGSKPEEGAKQDAMPKAKRRNAKKKKVDDDVVEVLERCNDTNMARLIKEEKAQLAGKDIFKDRTKNAEEVAPYKDVVGPHRQRLKYHPINSEIYENQITELDSIASGSIRRLARNNDPQKSEESPKPKVKKEEEIKVAAIAEQIQNLSPEMKALFFSDFLKQPGKKDD